MIRDLKPYPAYAESELPWLGSIPEGWEVRRNGRLFAQRIETGRAELPILEVSLRTGVRVRSFGEGERKQTMADPEKYKRAAKGDLAYNMMRMWQGALGVSPVDGLVSPAYIVAHPFDDVEAHFYAYLFRTDAYLNEVDKFSRGIVKDRNRLYWEDFKRIPSPYPPKEEQAAIVRFLDHADRRIRRAIRVKRKLIALLNEQKQVIIRNAISKGVNDDVTYRATGIPWIGNIPTHWSMSRVKTEFICLNNKRVPLSGTARGEMTNRAFDYYGASSVIDRVDDFIFDEDLLLIAEDGANLVLRNLPLAIIARGQYWVNNHAHILRPRSGNLEFLRFLMESINYLPWISGAAQPKLTKDRLLSIPIAVPPLAEQNQIVKTIHQSTESLSGTINLAINEVQLLLELRTRLISDVVNGKLDVREAASHLPAEGATTGPADDTEAILEDEENPEDAETEEVEA